MGLDEIGELQKEWRAIVLDKLTSVEQNQKEIKVSMEINQKEVKADILEIKTTFVKQQALETLRETNRTDIELLTTKVDRLENFKNRAIGIFIGVQGFLFVLAWILDHFWPK